MTIRLSIILAMGFAGMFLALMAVSLAESWFSAVIGATAILLFTKWMIELVRDFPAESLEEIWPKKLPEERPQEHKEATADS